MDDVVPLIVAPFHFNEYLDRLPKSLVCGRRIPWLEGATPIAFAASVIPGRIAAKRFAPDIVHNTFYYPARAVPGARRILTIHDMIHERYPAMSRANPLIARWKAACVRMADHVICDSANTRRDVLDRYDVAQSKVSVTHLGYDDLVPLVSGESPAAFRSRLFGADVPYLLYVGARSSYKNFAGLLSAYATSKPLRENFQLLCFGGGAFTAAEKSAIARANVAGRVTQLAGSDAVLADCYARAALFVYPSLYEGFGIPPLEAMSLDCPVACGNNSSLPEVVGDAAATFDSSDFESIRAVIERVLASPSLTAELVERGRSRTRLFSWKKCAASLLDTYRSVLVRPMRL